MQNNLFRHRTANGIDLRVQTTDRYKTTLIDLFLRTELGPDATQVALIPAILKRGSQLYPGITPIEQKLESLYGARFEADVLKVGEHHLIQLQLSLPNGRFVPGEPNLLTEGIAFLAELTRNPVVEADRFRPDVLEQEKEHLRNHIDALFDDKEAYAAEKLIRTLCKDEPYGIYEYGQTDRLPSITPTSLYRFYRRALETWPIEIYLTGDVDPTEAAARIEEAFRFDRQPDLSPPSVPEPVGQVSETVIREEQAIQQGKLCIGYRTFTTAADPDAAAMLFMNGLLGGFPHSKLFKNVREKEAMAYHAYSSYDRLKGLILIASGIDPANYPRAVACIQEQVQALQAGQIDDDEMTHTRVGLTDRLLSMTDAPGLQHQFELQQRLGGGPESIEAAVETLATITKDQVVDAAGKLQLDTIYFLAPTESATREAAQ